VVFNNNHSMSQALGLPVLPVSLVPSKAEGSEVERSLSKERESVALNLFTICWKKW